MKHEMRSENRDFGYCGSHYCGGHYDHYIVCTCGYDKQYYGEFSKAVAEHKEKVLGEALGIEFSIHNS